jgi:hypothetical protein
MSEYTLSDFTSAGRRNWQEKHFKFYETYEYPQYEKICWKLNKYLNRPPEEILHNLNGAYGDDYERQKKYLYNALKIFEACENGNLTELKAIHNKGYSIGFYKDTVMKTAVKNKQLHIVCYLCNKYRKRYSDWDITEHFPVLNDLVNSKIETEKRIMQEKIDDLEQKIKTIKMIL